MMRTQKLVGNNTININSAQFKQWLPLLNDNILQQLANQARKQGINEQDIQSGLKMINNMRSSGNSA